MKFAVFYTTLFVGVPLLIAMCCTWKKLVYWVQGAMIVSLLSPDQMSIAFLARPFYSQVTRGVEIHVADMLGLVLLGYVLLNRGTYKARFNIPLLIPYLIYFSLAVTSWLTQNHNTSLMIPEEFWKHMGADALLYQMYDRFDTHLYPLFELTLVARGLVIFWVSSHILRDEKARDAVIYGMLICAFFLTMTSIIGRYGYGEVRVTGFFSHPNVLNSFMAMLGIGVLPFAFEKKNFTMSAICAFAAMCCLLVIVLTVSRSSLAGYLLGAVLVCIPCVLRYRSMRNTAWVTIGVLGAFLFLGKAADTMLERFENETYAASMFIRKGFIDAAKLMAVDYPLGVGLGNFSAMSWVKYGELAGSPPGALVHNMWYLNMAELGYIGLAAFAMVWLRYYQYSIQCLFSHHLRKDPNRFAWVVCGIMATVPLQFQNMFHHASRFLSVYVLTHVLLGAVTAIYLQERADRRRKKPVATPQKIAVKAQTA